MSQTQASIGLGIGGALISTYLGAGPAVGFMAGSTLGAFLFSPDEQDMAQTSPRLSDVSVSSSAYGRTIPTILGTARIAGNVIASSDKLETRYEQSVGKGLGGGQEVETFRYRVHFLWAACRGDGSQKLLKVYADKKLIFDATNQTNTIIGGATQAQPGFKLRWLPGGPSQLVDPRIEELFGENNASANRQLACVMFEDFQLEAYGNRVPQIEAVISSTAGAAFPFINADFITEAEGGVFNGFQANRFAVDYKRHRHYLFDINGSIRGARVFDSRTMQEILQVTATQMATGTPFNNASTNFTGIIGINPIDGSMICNGSGGNASPIYRIDPETFQYTHEFGTGGIDLSFSPDGFPTLTRGVVFSCFSLAGYRSFFICSAIVGTGVGIVDAANLDYISDFATGAGQVTTFIPVKPQEEKAICYAVCAQDGGTHTVLRVTVDFYAVFGQIGTGVTFDTIGVDVETIFEFDQGAHLGGASSSGVSGGWWDETDDTIIVQFDTNAGDRMIKYDPHSDSIVWNTLLPAGSARGTFLGSQFDLVRNNIIGWASAGVNPSVHKIDTRSGEVVYSVTGSEAGNWLSGSESLTSYNSGEDSIIDGGRQKVFLERLTEESDITLREAVETILGQAGYSDTEFDMAALTGVSFPGYIMSRPSNARNFIEQLATAFFFSIVESDYVLKGVLKSVPTTIAVTEDDLGQVSGELEGVPLLIERQQEEELPGKVTVLYAEPDRDYQTGTQNVARISLPDLYTMQSDHNLVVEMPIMLDADDARQMAEKMLFTAWVERLSFQLVLPWRYLALDPADVIELTMNDGSTYLIRATKVDLGANLTMDVAGVSDDTPSFTSTIVGAGGDDFKDKTLFTPVPTELFILQTPLLRDGDDRNRIATVFYAAAGAYDATWQAAFLYESPDGSTYSQVDSFLDDVIWGGVVGVVPSPPGDNPFVTDTVTEIVVRLTTPGASLSSVTQDALLADEAVNACLIGDEIIRFQNATDNGDGTWTLDTLLRGRRGTDYSVQHHGVGERFILLDQVRIVRVEKGLNAIGTTRFFKGVSIGESIADSLATMVTVEGNDMKPYAPETIERDDVVDDPNIVVTWTRRTRIDNEFRDGEDIAPLNEDSEAYEAYILAAAFDPDTFDPDDSGTYVRAFTSLTTPTLTYTSAQQSTDAFTKATDTLHVVVFQVSAQVGRGWPGPASLPPPE